MREPVRVECFQEHRRAAPVSASWEGCQGGLPGGGGSDPNLENSPRVGQETGVWASDMAAWGVRAEVRRWEESRTIWRNIRRGGDQPVTLGRDFKFLLIESVMS